MSLIPEATYPARAVEYEFGTSDQGTEQIGVSFRITQGDYAGRVLTWYGFFNTPENAQRAIKSLRACGWKGDDLTTLTGLTENDVNIVVEIDDYKGERKNKIAWVNGAGVAMKNVMTEQQKKALAARMKGLILAGGGGARPATAAGRQPQRNGNPGRAPAPTQDDYDNGYGGAGDDIPF